MRIQQFRVPKELNNEYDFWQLKYKMAHMLINNLTYEEFDNIFQFQSQEEHTPNGIENVHHLTFKKQELNWTVSINEKIEKDNWIRKLLRKLF